MFYYFVGCGERGFEPLLFRFLLWQNVAFSLAPPACVPSRRVRFPIFHKPETVVFTRRILLLLPKLATKLLYYACLSSI